MVQSAIVREVPKQGHCPACNNAGEAYAQKNGFQAFRCDSCGTIFIYPDPTPAETSSIYDKGYFCGGGSCGGYTDYDEDKKAMEATFRKILSILREQNGGPGSLLDVGAATGYFVALAREAGWDAEGIEISGYAVAVAQAKNIPVVQGTLLSFAPLRTFDVITLWDVFEHLTQPQQHLQAVLRLLKPGGIFALITPKADAAWARMAGARWHLLIPPEHVTCYSTTGIRRILAANGFQVFAIAAVAKRFSIPYVLHIAKNWLGWRWLTSFGKFAQRFPGNIAVPLNFRDNMFVIARKVS
jgi:SAM-dependent methyltransferase